MADPSLIERLAKRAKQDRDCATNSAVVVDLLAPEMAKFEARAGHNIYAVRMAVDHKNSVKRDNAFADDLEAAASTLEDQARLIGELQAFKARVLAAVQFEEPTAVDDAAVHSDIAAGMSLRKCAAKHGLTFGQIRGAAKRGALLTKLKASVDGATK